MNLTKIELDDVGLLGELLPLGGDGLWVQTLFERLASASAFVADSSGSGR